MSSSKKCHFCKSYFADMDSYSHHIEKIHSDLVPDDMDGYQFLYWLRTKKTHGKCVICGKETGWNPKTHKYHRFCKNPKCKEKYIEEFRSRMIGKHGKIMLLNDPEHQKKMLQARKISGIYKWSDDSEIPYTGSYEKNFLMFLDLALDYDPSDIFSPSPHTYYYEYEERQHFYIPDIYIASLNLEIEIKDGGNNPNMHPKIQAVDKEKERLKDALFMSNKNTFNYLKITNKNNGQFFKYLELAKQQFKDGTDNPIILLK